LGLSNAWENKIVEPAYKPSFVLTKNLVRDGHSSGPKVALGIKQSTHSSNNANNISEPIRSYTGWGLQASRFLPGTGGLLHHLFTLTPLKVKRSIFCCTFHDSP